MGRASAVNREVVGEVIGSSPIIPANKKDQLSYKVAIVWFRADKVVQV